MSCIEKILQKDILLNKRYQVVSSLGKGGFGITYLCLDKANNEYVAIKEFFPKEAVRNDSLGVSSKNDDNSHYFSVMQNFLEEANILSSIDDIRIVRVRESFEENGTAYYVMEYIEGPTLKDYIKQNGPLESKEALRLIEEVSMGLKTIHDRGFIHGDLKPTNIMLKKSRMIKIMDFGAASTKDSLYTKVHSNVVSWNYSSPERFSRSSMIRPASDIYSLGCVLFFMVSGFDPLPATERLKGAKIPIPPTTRKIKHLINKSMALDEFRRFFSVDLFLKACKSFFPL